MDIYENTRQGVAVSPSARMLDASKLAKISDTRSKVSKVEVAPVTLELFDTSGKRYFYYYVSSNSLKQVTVHAFKKGVGKVISFRNCLIKVVGSPGTKIPQRFFIKTLEAQGLCESFKDILSGLSVVVTALGHLGKATRFVTKSVILASVKLLVELGDLLKGETFDPMNLISIMLSCFLLREELSAQGMTTLAAGIALDFLPPSISSTLRKIINLSNMKFMDDASCFYSVFKCVVSLLRRVIEESGIAETKVGKSLCSFLSTIMLHSSHFLVVELEKHLNCFKKDAKVIASENFRVKVAELELKVREDLSVTEWSRRSSGVQAILLGWSRLVKACATYAKTARQEPSCFIFEGPPGTLKSVMMNGLVEMLGQTNYTHAPKNIGDGKDFFDLYQNQENFIMDDVGQGSISQWRMLMNLVSSVQYPLDCAEASLKNTKFFTSEKIFITTNRFQHLQSLTKNDCIDDPRALWRRGLVFDFSQVKRVGDGLRGTITFRHFDLRAQRFVDGFPLEFEKLNRHGVSFVCDDAFAKASLLKWMMVIVSYIQQVKNQQSSANVITKEQREIIRMEVREQLELLAQAGESPESDEGDEFQHEWTIAGDWFVHREVYASSWFQEFVSHFFSSVTKEFMSVIAAAKTALVDYYPYLLALVGGVVVIGALRLLLQPKKEEVKATDRERQSTELSAEAIFSSGEISVHNSIVKIMKNVYEVDLVCEDVVMKSRALLSGRGIVLPAHLAVKEQLDIVVYSNRERNCRVVDGEVITRVYINHKEDVAVYRFVESFPSPFKEVTSHVKVGHSSECGASYLVSQKCWAPLGTINVRPFVANLVYRFRSRFGDYENRTGNAIAYDYQASGFCGSVVVNQHDGIQGMHVAGSAADQYGVAIVWSDAVKTELLKHLRMHAFSIPFVMREAVSGQDTSVIRLEGHYNSFVPFGTNFGKSPLYGIFDVEREPANLVKYGRFTVKDIAKKSFSACVMQDTRELDFADSVMLAGVIAPFGELSDLEVIRGNEDLAGLNKDSSNGYLCEKEKSVYIDFDKGEVTPRFDCELKRFVERVENDDVDWEKLFWVESLKDELRDLRKKGEPRSFRIGTIHQQFLVKKLFGNFVANVMQSRDHHEIMIGCNPLKEWPAMYNSLVNSRGIFAGDIAKWDGSMLGQVQRRVCMLLEQNYTGERKKLLRVMLETLVHSFVIVKDDLYLTTHSMPSGSFLTAIFNSVVNKYYTAMWYFRQISSKGITPSVSSFWSDVVDYVYGDDKLNAVVRHDDVLNAITMRDFFLSCGMDFTDSKKSPIVTPFQTMEEVTFLKRSFVYHNELKKVVCPLDLKTLKSGLSYADYTKDVVQILNDKINNYQREIFLHGERAELLQELRSKLQERQWDWKQLPHSYLLHVYSKDELSLPTYVQRYE